MTTLIDLSTASDGRARPAPGAPRSARRPSAERTVPLSPTFRPPLVPDVESKPEWDSHLRGLAEDFAPQGYAEDACVFRIASLLWRLNRLTQSEVDDLSQSVAAAEPDAATAVAARASEPASVKALLPVDVAALRRCAKDAALAAEVLAAYHTLPNHEPVPDEHARVAHYYLGAYCTKSANVPPADPPPAGWDGTRLRSSLCRFAVDRSLYDDLTAATQFALDVSAAAEQRLAEIEALASRLRRERLVPQSPLAAAVRESEATLSLALDQAIEQLGQLQSRR